MAVPRREAPRRRLDARLVLGHQERVFANCACELGVRRRIVTVDAAAEHRDGMAVRLEGSAVSLAVDSARKPADNDDTGTCEIAAEHARNLRAVGRASARANDRDRGP
jgi:hypothetical protein